MAKLQCPFCRKTLQAEEVCGDTGKIPLHLNKGKTCPSSGGGTWLITDKRKPVTKHPLADIRFDALTQRIAVLEEWKSRCEQGDRDYEDWLQSMSKKMPPDPKKVEQDTYLGKAVTLGQYKEAWKFLAETSSGPCMCHYVRPEKCPRCRANRLLGKLRGVK